MADDNFIGEIVIVAFNYAPRAFAFCDGRLMSISQNTALFSLLGSTYGGDGQTTFALPDLRGRVGIHFGQGTGLSNYVLGEISGVEGVTLNINQLAAHTHAALASNVKANSLVPTGNTWAGSAAGDGVYSGAVPDTQLSPAALAPAGSFSPSAHENRMPFLAINFCICLAGIFPVRD